MGANDREFVIYTRPRASRGQIKRNAKILDRIMAEYRDSEEAKGLDKRSTAELVEMHNGDSEWLRRPSGDIGIDGRLCARARIVGDILTKRTVPFKMGRFEVQS